MCLGGAGGLEKLKVVGPRLPGEISLDNLRCPGWRAYCPAPLVQVCPGLCPDGPGCHCLLLVQVALLHHYQLCSAGWGPSWHNLYSGLVHSTLVHPPSYPVVLHMPSLMAVISSYLHWPYIQLYKLTCM